MDGQLLADTFVELTDTMVADFDVIDFLLVLTDRSVQLLDVSAAGLLLADPRGELRVVAASSEAARLRAYAYANDLRLTDVAGDIVARRLRLHPGPGPSPESNA